MADNLFKKDLMFFLHLLTRLDVSSKNNTTIQKYFNALQNDKMKVDKVLYRFNTYFKGSDLSREEKAKRFYEIEWISAVENNDFADMLNFIKENDFEILPEIPISHVLKDRNHQILCWYYILGLCFTSEISLLEKRKDEIDQELFNNKMKNVKGKLKEVMFEKMEYETAHKISELIDPDIIKGQENKISKEGIQEAASKVEEMFTSKGGKSAEAIGKIVKKLSQKLQENVDEEDGINMFNIMNIAKDIAKDVATEINPKDIDHAEIMNISRNVGIDMMNKISPEEKEKMKNANPMMAEMMKTMENPDKPIDISVIEKMAKEQGINPDEMLKKMEEQGGGSGGMPNMDFLANFLNMQGKK